MAEPYWYLRQLKNDWVIDENTTNRFDLPDQGAVSGLLAVLNTKNEEDLSSYDDPYFVQRISKLRIVGNGNYPIVDLMGKMVHSMNFWDRGTTSLDGLSTVDTEQQQQYIYIPFGEYLGDPDHGLWLEKFGTGVQWEETNNISTTYFADGYSKMSIYALMRKNPEAELFSKGFLRKRQIIKKDAASETKYAVKIDSENKLRQIHLFSEPTVTSGSLSTTCFTLTQYLFLSIKSRGEYILDNVLSSDWARFIHDYAERKARTSVRFRGGAAGSYYDTCIAEKVTGSIQHMSANAYFDTTTTATDQTQYQRVYQFLHDGTAATSMWGRITSEGILLHGDIPLLPLKPNAPESQWLDAKENKTVYVEVTEGSSAGNWYIVLDELQPTYPT